MLLAALKGPEPDPVHPIFGAGDARSEGRQIEEVATRGRKPLDLLLGHVRRDLGRAHLHACGGRNGDDLELNCRSAELEVKREHLPNQHSRAHLLGRHADLPRRHVVLGRHEPENRVEPVALRRNLALRGRRWVHGDHPRPSDRVAARVGHISPDATGARLRHDRRRGNDQKDQAEQ